MEINNSSPASDTPVTLFGNKEAHLRYNGEDTVFSLSHSLFSSFDIDQGSKLLLKTIASHIGMDSVGSLLDIGSGVGVLGIALTKKHPGIKLVSADRDALALAFTKANSLRNGIADCTVLGSIGLINIPDETFDLIVSNIPAKAGNKAISQIVSGMSAFLRKDGIFACVIVRTLENLVEEAVINTKAEIIFRETTQNHAVYHIRWENSGKPDRTLAPYIRGKSRFDLKTLSYELQTVFGLPEFDTLSYATSLFFDAFEGIHLKGKALIWNPGQGHLPVYLHRTGRLANTRLTLASRDLLSLEISRINCIEAGMDVDAIAILHIPSIFSIEETYDCIMSEPDRDPGAAWTNRFLGFIVTHLSENGLCAIVSKSSAVFQILKNAHAVKLIEDSREKGFRSVVLKKK